MQRKYSSRLCYNERKSSWTLSWWMKCSRLCDGGQKYSSRFCPGEWKYYVKTTWGENILPEMLCWLDLVWSKMLCVRNIPLSGNDVQMKSCLVKMLRIEMFLDTILVSENIVIRKYSRFCHDEWKCCVNRNVLRLCHGGWKSCTNKILSEWNIMMWKFCLVRNVVSLTLTEISSESKYSSRLCHDGWKCCEGENIFLDFVMPRKNVVCAKILSVRKCCASENVMRTEILSEWNVVR